MNKYLISIFVLFLAVSCNKKSQEQNVNQSGEKLVNISYCNYQTDELIEEDCTEKQAIDYFKKLPKTDDSFISIGFNDKQVIQFVWERNGKCLAEITNDGLDRVFMQRYATVDECIEMIKTAYNGDPNNLQGFVPVPIMEKTLDEVLADNK